MEKVKLFLKDKLKKLIYYIFLGLIFIVIALIIAVPFVIKDVKFKNDNILYKTKTYNVISIEGKVNVKLFGDYVKTGISYDKYNTYIKSYSKNSTFKRVMVIELFLLFILFELICLHYLISNIISIFIDKEKDEYKLYLVKKSFAINALSIYIVDFFRRFLFRNTIFSSLSLSLVIYYAFSCLIMMYIIKILNMNKVSVFKEKKNYEKIRENN